MDHTGCVGVGVLGAVVAVASDGHAHFFGDGLGARLLSVLAASPNEAVPAATLADSIWSGHPPKSARNAIQVQVHRLRQRLAELAIEAGPSIRTDAHGYTLEASPLTLDVLGFESLFALARSAAERGDLEAAVEFAGSASSLHRGEPFGGFADEIGLDGQSARLTERRLDVEDLLAETLVDCGGAIDVGQLRALAQASPFRERRWGYLMLGLFRTGRQAEALRTYNAAARMLGEQLGIQPGAELRRLEERILLQDAALLTELASAPSIDLPAFPTRFIGRRHELGELGEQVLRDRVVTLVGLGGAGKTRLAVAVAAAIASQFDTVTFVGLADTNAGDDLEHLLQGRLAPLERAESAPVAAVIQALRDRHTLLVLDQVEDQHALVRHVVDELTRACPHVHVLITSRRPVGARGEHVRRVSSLEIEDAIDLFGAAAERVAPNALGDEHDSDVITRICEAVGRIPLLVELAAAQLGSRSVERVAEVVHRRFELDPGEDDLTAVVLSWGLDLLSDDERRAASALSVFRGGWREADAEIVLAAAGVDGRVASRLIDRSLIAFDPLTGRGSMLPPVRDAISSRCPSVVETAAEAHANHFAEIAQRELLHLTTFDHAVSLQLLDHEQHNIRAALEWGIAKREPSMLVAMPTFGVYLWRRSRSDEGRRWFDVLEAEFDPLVEYDPMCALYSAHLAMWSSRPDLADARLDSAEAHIRSLDSPRLLGRLLHARGNVEGWGRGRAGASLDFFRAAHETLTADDDPFAVVSTVCEGYMAVRAGRAERALEVIEILASGDVRALTGSTGVDMVRGLAALYEGEHDLADHLMVSACDKLEKLGVAVLKGPGLTPLVWISVLRDRPNEAIARSAEAYRFSSEHGGRWRIGDAATASGIAQAACGDHAAARSWFERGLRAGLRAPEFDVVAVAAAGLIEVGAWLDECRRTTAAAEVRGLMQAHEFTLPVGFEQVFPRVYGAPIAAEPASVPRLVHLLREVLDGA